MSSKNQSLKISTLSRILAWIFILCGVLGIAGWIVRIISEGWEWGWGAAILVALGLLFYLLLFLFAAVIGRSPCWLTSIENMYDDEANRRGIVGASTCSSRGLISWVASIVFGLYLIYFGNWLGVFSGENRWFAGSIFAVVWLIVVALMWWYCRKVPAGGKNDPKGKTGNDGQ